MEIRLFLFAMIFASVFVPVILTEVDVIETPEVLTFPGLILVMLLNNILP